MKYTVEEIAKSVNLDPSDILNVYCYGSRVYGTDDEESDDDFVVVHKGSSIKNPYNDQLSFKQNAMSSEDGQIQVIRYSRSGFLAAIDDYEIGALECLFLPEDKIVQEKASFNIRNFDKPSVNYEVKRMVKKIITKASNSWFLANRHLENAYLADDAGNAEEANERFFLSEKGYFHAIRILMFGLQIKEHRKIVDYTEANYIWDKLLALEEPLTFGQVAKEYLPLRNELMDKLKK